MPHIDTLCTMYTPVLKVRGIIADCDGFALVCCVKEEGVGWVMKRSKTGAGLATLFCLDYDPTLTGFTANGTGFWVSHGNVIKQYSARGACLRTISWPVEASSLEFLGDMLYFIAKRSSQERAQYALNTTSQDHSLLAHDVKPSGGLALFATAQKLLFISSRNSLCQLDLQSRECQVITPSVWPGGGRLLTGNDKLALLIVPIAGGSIFLSCSADGKLCSLEVVPHTAVSAGFGLNSRGDLLFIEQKEKELPRIRCLPALLPPPTACKCKT